MKNAIIIGSFIAIVTGILITIQATFSGRGGNIIGPVRTGIITNLGSGLFAVLFLAISIIWHTLEWKSVPQATVGSLLFSGGLGILIVIGISFALQYTGVTAGTAAVILGQLLVSTIVDATGLSGKEVIPITGQRVLGLLVMAIAVYLLLPRE